MKKKIFFFCWGERGGGGGGAGGSRVSEYSLQRIQLQRFKSEKILWRGAGGGGGESLEQFFFTKNPNLNIFFY